MSPDQLEADLTAALADRQLLTHPFYRRWDAGTLQPGELGAYAGQYRHFEAALPGILRVLLTQLEPGRAADLVQGNLADEESNPEPHVDVFAAFADALDPAMRRQALPPSVCWRRIAGSSNQAPQKDSPR